MSTELKNILLTKNQQLISTGINKLNPTDTGYENDLVFGELKDLVNDRFRPWYCKVFYKLGRERIFILAAQARADGQNPQRLFSHLLKKAMEKASA